MRKVCELIKTLVFYTISSQMDDKIPLFLKERGESIMENNQYNNPYGGQYNGQYDNQNNGSYNGMYSGPQQTPGQPEGPKKHHPVL